MTDAEVIAKIGNKLLMCDKDCFALVNRFLNKNARQARVQAIREDIIDFTVERLEVLS
jgi:hypothetical protein